MISPTGQGIRVDNGGSGVYGAYRKGGRKHKGVDYLCEPGQVIVAPFRMVIDRIAKPYASYGLTGIAFHNAMLTGKMFYFEVDPDLVGTTVHKGGAIGLAQDVSKIYGGDMKPHVHLEITSINAEFLRNMENSLRAVQFIKDL